MDKTIKTVTLNYEKVMGKFVATFTIGVQTFHLSPVETKKEAKWFCEQLETAFNNLSEPYFGEGNTPSFKQNCKALANPKIMIEYGYKTT